MQRIVSESASTIAMSSLLNSTLAFTSSMSFAAFISKIASDEARVSFDFTKAFLPQCKSILMCDRPATSTGEVLEDRKP